MGTWKQTYQRIIAIAILVGVILAPSIYSSIAIAAPTYSSTTYGVDEVFMGSGGVNNATSASYQARASLGDTGVGNSGSASFQAYGGFTTTPDPYLEFVVTGGNVDLGLLTTGSAKTGTATFTVRTYLASGYNVTTTSDAPNNGSYILAGINLPGEDLSHIGTEQFGINLVANALPVAVGADPAQIPGPSYSFGTAAAGYNNPDHYKYVKGDVIANSTKSSGTTQFTISYLINIKPTTPGGQYSMNHGLVATSTF